MPQNIQAITAADSHPENELLILSGIYGAKGITNDVTDLLRSKIEDGRLELQVTNYEMGGDPRPKARKTLTITYISSGRTSTRVVSERDILSLP